MLRDEWTFVEVVLAVCVAYFTGQIAAAPSSVILEHWLARRVLHPPTALLLAMVPTRSVDRFLARWVVGRYYEPLPGITRSTILEKAAAATKASTDDLASDPEAVFGPAFAAARKDQDASQRMDGFRNQYGLNRNMSFTAFLASVAFLANAIFSSHLQSLAWAALALLLAVGLFARFLKFYSAFAAEVLRTFAFVETDQKKGGG